MAKAKLQPVKQISKAIAAKHAASKPAPKPGPIKISNGIAPKPAPAPAAQPPAVVEKKENIKTMSSPEQSHPIPSADGDARSQVLRGGAGNVDKIRDILFGTQMRDYDSRFARLEETLVKENAEIRET